MSYFFLSQKYFFLGEAGMIKPQKCKVSDMTFIFLRVVANQCECM